MTGIVWVRSKQGGRRYVRWVCIEEEAGGFLSEYYDRVGNRAAGKWQQWSHDTRTLVHARGPHLPSAHCKIDGPVDMCPVQGMQAL